MEGREKRGGGGRVRPGGKGGRVERDNIITNNNPKDVTDLWNTWAKSDALYCSNL